MKILFCSPEVYPFSKLGGLADFSAALPQALNALENEVYVVSPYYKNVNSLYGPLMKYLGEKKITFGDTTETAKYYSLTLNGVSYFFISHPFFDRKNIFSYDDDAIRFLFFNLAVLEMLSLINFYPEIIHLNDWTTSLIPFILSENYSNDENYKNIKTLLTIHNLEKQGSFLNNYEHLFPKNNFTFKHLNNINFLKAGIMRSTKINTVSKSYKNEILTPFYSFSLDGALKSRQHHLHGIQNGLDFDLYNPSTDSLIFKQYDNRSVLKGKRVNKELFLNEINFKDPNKMIVSFIGRFAREKGIHLLSETFNHYLDSDDFYFFIIGEGDPQSEDYFNNLQIKYPNNVYYVSNHDFETSQKMYAASDLLIMPSLYEASGLNQMIAMRYGTIPLVRNTGGLSDTVNNYNFNTFEGNGFVFNEFNSTDFKESIDLALKTYYNDNENWNKIIQNAMAIDNDIDLMASEYNELYKKM